MKSIVLNLKLSLVVCLLNSSAFCQETDNSDTKAAKYVIYSEPEDAQLGASLFRVLIGADKNVRFEKAETMDKAIQSDANVIVVVATFSDRGWGALSPHAHFTYESFDARLART